MNKIYIAFLLVCSVLPATASLIIDGKNYQVDTIFRRQIGPGVVNTIVRLPSYPLNVYILETDLNNPYNRVETTMAYNTLGQTETLVNAYLRNCTTTKRPLAACNSNFWCTIEQPYAQFEKSVPFGASVRNDTTYLNTNRLTDPWIAGPQWSGGVAIDHDKRLYLGHFLWTGTVSSSKLSDNLQFYSMNRRCIKGELSLFNVAYGRMKPFADNWVSFSETGTNNTDNYYIDFIEGDGWKVNKDMKFTIKKIVKGFDCLTLGDFDACLTATGDFKEKMAVLSEGDEITINEGWMTNDEVKIFPYIENMIEGNGHVMHNGELTERNYTLNGGPDNYNNVVYSRTGYGCSADGKHLYMVVIDKSTSPLYGLSSGCTTAVMCQILKGLCPLVSEITTHDAGGSAQMMVKGKVINTTTESTPRPVANGWMLMSIAPEDQTIASIQFAAPSLKLPAYSEFTPRLIGYNQYGDIVNENVIGFTLSCDTALGMSRGSCFVPSGGMASGILTADYQGMKATVKVSVLQGKPEIAIKPCVLVDDREWSFPAMVMLNGTAYPVDSSYALWHVGDQSVAKHENGKLKGLKNGSTTLYCTVDGAVDSTLVKVEISDLPYRFQSFMGWTFKGLGASDIQLTENGTLSFNYAASRGAYLKMNKEIVFYGLPTEIGMTFVTSMNVSKVQFNVYNSHVSAPNYQKFDNNSAGFKPGEDYTVKLDLNQLGGLEHLETYPVELKDIRFDLENKAQWNGVQTIRLKSIYAHYLVSGLRGDINQDNVINVSDVTALINCILGINACDESLCDLNGDGIVNVSDVTVLINLILGNN